MDVPGWDAPESLSGKAIQRAILGFLALGLALRLVRYATNQPLWGDEAYLSWSLLTRDFAGLLRPLEYHQVAPPLFLWSVKACLWLFGLSELVLRAFPLACGLLSVVLFERLASRFLAGVPRLLAVGTFAVSFYPIRHATEIKPYATDLAVALCLLLLAVSWLKDQRSTRWLWALSVCSPIALALSHPAVFVAGGIAVALVPSAFLRGSTKTRIAFLTYLFGLVVAFLSLYVLITRDQAASAGAETRAYWARAFPDLDRPLSIPFWLLEVHTSNMFAYPLGADRGGSAATTALFFIGFLVMRRLRRLPELGLLLAPLGLGLLAAFLGRYPYGGSARTMQYAAPAICLLLGLGWARLLGCLPRPRRRNLALVISLVLLATVGVTIGAIDVLQPYKFPEDAAARSFARTFWTSYCRDADLVCLKQDLGVSLDPVHWQTGRSAVYLCHQAIYSPRHRLRQAPDFSRVTAGHPLRCVLYNQDPESPALEEWLRAMGGDFTLLRQFTLTAVPVHAVGGLRYEDRYNLYDFVPRHPEALSKLSAKVYSGRMASSTSGAFGGATASPVAQPGPPLNPPSRQTSNASDSRRVH